MQKKLAVIFLLAAGTALAADSPKLRDTELFSKIAKGCKDVNLDGWHHSTGQVFTERGIKLEKISLCNSNKFPIFYAEVPYDPHFAHNDNYFTPLYRALLKANGQWPFAIVATSNNTIIVITGKSNAIKEELEDYSQ